MTGDGERPLAVATAREFLGQMSGLDAFDIPAGAASVQTNVVCTRPGELRVRGGLRAVTFDED